MANSRAELQPQMKPGSHFITEHMNYRGSKHLPSSLRLPVEAKSHSPFRAIHCALRPCQVFSTHAPQFSVLWNAAQGWNMGVGQWLIILSGIGSGVWGFVVQRKVLEKTSTKPPPRQWLLGNHVRIWTALSAGMSGFVLYELHGAWWAVDMLFVFGLVLLIGWEPGTPPPTDDSGLSQQPNQTAPVWWQIEMNNFDQAFAWLILADGIFEILWTEIRHPPGAVLDTGLLWIFLAMFNFLRIRNGDAIRQLRTYCMAANVTALLFEINRLKMFGGYPTAITTGILVLDTLFSTVPRSKSWPIVELPGTPQTAKPVGLYSVLTTEPLGKNVPAKTWNRAVHIIFYSSVLMALFIYQLGKARGRYENRMSEYTSLKAQYDVLQTEYSSLEKEYSRLEAEYSDLKAQYDRIESGRKTQTKK
jgi:hypothetical protein